MEHFKVFDIGPEPTNLSPEQFVQTVLGRISPEPTNTIAAIFMTFSLLFIVGLVVAYLFSIASAGNTLIYTILRRRVDGENLLEVEDEADVSAPVVPEAPPSEAALNPDTTEGEEKTE